VTGIDSGAHEGEARIFLVGGPACGNEYELPEATAEFHVALVPLSQASPATVPVPVDLHGVRRAIYERSTCEGGRWRYCYLETVGG
jgi:hypothetical protein